MTKEQFNTEVEIKNIKLITITKNLQARPSSQESQLMTYNWTNECPITAKAIKTKNNISKIQDINH